MVPDQKRRRLFYTSNRSAQITLLLIAVAIVVLLVGITRYDWLEIKPAIGTATALADASDQAADKGGPAVAPDAAERPVR